MYLILIWSDHWNHPQSGCRRYHLRMILGQMNHLPGSFRQLACSLLHWKFWLQVKLSFTMLHFQGWRLFVRGHPRIHSINYDWSLSHDMLCTKACTYQSPRSCYGSLCLQFWTWTKRCPCTACKWRSAFLLFRTGESARWCLAMGHAKRSLKVLR